MHKRLSFLGAAACSLVVLLAAGPPAHAGPYAGVEGGVTLFNDDYTRVVIPPSPTIGAHTNFDVGWMAGANFPLSAHGSAGARLPSGPAPMPGPSRQPGSMQ